MSKLFQFDKKNKNATFLIGTDEAGRGPLAGPVVAAAVCFPEINKNIISKLELVNDSKKLSHKQREILYEVIKDNSIYSINEVGVKEIEQINILQAALKAMRISCEEVCHKLNSDCEVFVDGNKKIPQFSVFQRTIVKGDSTSASIAAASILAKVYRDNIMCEYAKMYPEYDFESNKGYGTQKHIEAIKKFGVTPIHRACFLRKILAPKVEQLELNLQ